MDNRQSSFENVLEALGVPGKFQLCQVLLIVLGKTFISFKGLSFVFLGYEPPHVCNQVNETRLLHDYGLANDSTAWIGYSSCHVTIYTTNTTTFTVTTTTTITTTTTSNNNNNSNSGFFQLIDQITCPNGRNFSNARDTSFISEWDLACESRGTSEFVETFAMVSGTISGFITTSVSDRYGRKTLYFSCSVIVLFFEIIVIFSPTIYTVMGLRLVSGFFYQGVVCTYFVLAIELMVPRHRQALGVFVCLVWVFHLLLFAAIAYGFQNYNWRYLQGAIAGVGAVCVCLQLFVKESVRWLSAMDNRKKALQVFKFACKQNGTDFECVKTKLYAFWKSNDEKKLNEGSNGAHEELVSENKDERSDMDEMKLDAKVKKTKGTILTLLRNKKLRRMTFLTWFIWTTHNVTYYGLFMASTKLSGNRFLNFTLMALVEIPSNIAVLVMMNKMNRRSVLAFFLGLSALFLMMSSLLLTFGDDSSASDIASTVFLIMGKFAIGSSFNAIYIITPELYPTNVRAIGNGFNSSGSKVGAMFAPFTRPLFTVAKWAPGTIFTVMCIISLVMILGLPETKNKDLPNYVKDIQNGKSEDKTKINATITDT